MKKYLHCLSLGAMIVTFLLGVASCGQPKTESESPHASQTQPESSHWYLIKRDSLWGYVNLKGEIVVNPQFDDARFFDNGLAEVRLGTRWGIIDESGKYIINPQFDDVSSFSEGLAAVGLGGKCGFMDKQGKIVINPQFDDVRSSFSEGLATVKLGGKYGLINKRGIFVVNPVYDYI